MDAAPVEPSARLDKRGHPKRAAVAKAEPKLGGDAAGLDVGVGVRRRGRVQAQPDRLAPPRASQRAASRSASRGWSSTTRPTPSSTQARKKRRPACCCRAHGCGRRGKPAVEGVAQLPLAHHIHPQPARGGPPRQRPAQPRLGGVGHLRSAGPVPRQRRAVRSQRRVHRRLIVEIERGAVLRRQLDHVAAAHNQAPVRVAAGAEGKQGCREHGRIIERRTQNAERRTNGKRRDAETQRAERRT